MTEFADKVTLTEMPNCCTGYIMHGFPFDKSHLFGNREDKPDYDKNMQEVLDAVLPRSLNFVTASWIVATLTNGQTTAISILKDLNFKLSGEHYKARYPEKIGLYSIKGADLVKACQVRDAQKRKEV